MLKHRAFGLSLGIPNWQRVFSEFLVDSEVLGMGFEEFSRFKREMSTKKIRGSSKRYRSFQVILKLFAV